MTRMSRVTRVLDAIRTGGLSERREVLARQPAGPPVPHVCSCSECDPDAFVDRCRFEAELYGIYHALHLVMEPDGHTAREHVVEYMRRVGDEPPE